MKRTLVCLIFILVATLARSQNKVVDSLLHQLSQTDDAKLKAEIYIGLASAYYFGPKSLESGKKALEIAQTTGDSQLIARALIEVGWSHYSDNNVDSAVVYVEDALKLLNGSKAYQGLADVYNLRGVLFMTYGQLSKAEENYLNSIDAASLGHLEMAQARGFNNLGILYSQNKMYDKALQQHQQCRTLSEQLDNSIYIGRSYYNIGVTYLSLQQYKQAYQWLMRSVRYRTELRYFNGVAEGLVSLAELFFELRGSPVAEPMLKQLTLDGYASPFQLLDEAIKLPGMKDNTTIAMKVNQAKIKGLYAHKRFKEAFDLLEQYHAAEDSMRLNDNNLNAIADLKVIYEKELLTHQNHLKEIELKNRKYGQLLLAALSLILLSLLIFVILFFKQKKNLNKLKHEREINQKLSSIRNLKSRTANLLDEKNRIVLSPLSDINDLLDTPLTDSEYKILQYIASGQTNREISEAQFVSVNTVKFHLKNIYSKLDVNNRKEALKKIVTLID